MKMNTKSIARIREMEEDFHLLRQIVDNLNIALDEFETAQGSVERLSTYQESGHWLKDYEADEKGLLPEDLPRGVLSEDGLYNLLRDVDALRARLMAIKK